MVRSAPTPAFTLEASIRGALPGRPLQISLGARRGPALRCRLKAGLHAADPDANMCSVW